MLTEEVNIWKGLVIVLATICLALFFYSIYLFQNRKRTSRVLRKRNAELSRLNQSKDRFLEIIAHDLRNPLNSILVFSNQLLKTKQSLSKEEQENINVLHRSAKNISDLIENLMKWIGTQRSQPDFFPVDFSLKAVVYECLEIMKPMYNKKNISVSLEVSGYDCVFADRNMILTVVRNFLSNAVKFSYEGGEILISIEEVEEEVSLKFKDHGVGMSTETQEKLFKIDSHFKNRGTHDERGTGLGLIIAHEFVHMNKGKIVVASKEGEGSSFTLILPAGDEPTE